jgi:chromosome segregation ATPase
MTELEALRKKYEHLRIRLNSHENAVKTLKDSGVLSDASYKDDETYLDRFIGELDWCKRKMDMLEKNAQDAESFKEQYKEIDDKLNMILFYSDRRFLEGIPFKDTE